jgi:hypothetical protein
MLPETLHVELPEYQLPPELKNIDRAILRQILPDLSVTAESNQPATHCHRVTFTVHLSPGLFQPVGNQAVTVRVIDQISGVPTTVGEVLLFLPAAGGSVSAMVEWPEPPDAFYGPDFFNEITVVVDPDNKIAERDESNNSVTVIGTCIG